MYKYYHERWLGWVSCALELQLVSSGLKPWLEQNNFLFVKTYFGMDVKRRKNPRRQLGRVGNHALIVNQ